MNVVGKYLKDENGNVISAVTSGSTVFDDNSNTLKDFWSFNNYDNQYLPNFAGYYNGGGSTTGYSIPMKKAFISLTVTSGTVKPNGYIFTQPLLAFGLIRNGYNSSYVAPFYENNEVFVRIEFDRTHANPKFNLKITCGTSDYCHGTLNICVLYHDGV